MTRRLGAGLFAAALLAAQVRGVSETDGVKTGAAPALTAATIETNRTAIPAAPIAAPPTGVVAGAASSVAATGMAARVAPTGGVAGATFGDAPTNQTVITSRQLLFDYRRSQAFFEDDVVVTDPQIRILSDLLTVTFDESNSVNVVTATRNVRLFSADRQGTCDRAVYKVKTGEIILTGSPVLKREKDVLKGGRITFWTDREVVVCENGELVVSPGTLKEKP